VTGAAVRAVVVALLLVVSGGAAPRRPAPAATARVEAQPPGDPWQFDDEEPGWRQVLRSQSTDLLAFGGFASLALAGFFRKNERLKYATFGASILYLGFAKSQLLSIVNIFAVIGGSLPVVRYNLAFYAFSVFALASTVLWGRLYCGRICAYGALTQVLDRVVPRPLRIGLAPSIERRAQHLKYAVLGGAVAYFLVTRDVAIYRYVEPFWMFGREGTTAQWIALAALLTATVCVRNLYCRFLCPVGALLGVLSNLTVFRIKRWSECRTCRICEGACEWGAIRGPTIVASECVRCDDCERFYMDTQKCPHWIVIRRRSDYESRQQPAPTAVDPSR
jgi:polyferredoxin